METIGITIMTLLVLFMGLLIVLLIRNEKVFKYRMNLIHEISAQASRDITAGRPWKHRYESYDSVSYQEQVFKFWKPLDSFYENKGRMVQ